MKSQFPATVDNSVAGIVSALVANHVVVFARDEVSDFAFAFVAPLGTDQNRAGHVRESFQRPGFIMRGSPVTTLAL